MLNQEQPRNLAEPPARRDGRSAASCLGFALLLVICMAMLLGNVWVSVLGVSRILDTTPFMGIPVDASGRPLPVEGYPQLALGLAGVVLSGWLLVLLVAFRIRKRVLSGRRAGR